MQVNNQILSNFQFCSKKGSEASGTNGFLELFEQVLAGAVETSDSVQSFTFIEAAIPITEENPDEGDSIQELVENQVEVQKTSFPYELDPIKHLHRGYSDLDPIKNLHSGYSDLDQEEMTKSASSIENYTNHLEGPLGLQRPLQNSVGIGSFVLPKEIDVIEGMDSKSKANLVNDTISQGSFSKEMKTVVEGATLATENVAQNTISLENKTVLQDIEKASDKSSRGSGNSEVVFLKQQPVHETKNPNANQNFSQESINTKANSSTNDLIRYADDLGQQPENSSRQHTWNSLANGITANELLKKEKKIVKDTEGKADSKIITQKDELVMAKPTVPPGGYQNLSSELDRTKFLSTNFNGTRMDAEVSKTKDLINTGTRSETEEIPQSATLRSYDQNLFQKNLSNVLSNVKEAPTPNIYQNQVHSQLIKSFSLMQHSNVNEVLINLKPEFLGKVSINLTIQNGEVIGKIAVAKKEVKDLIEGQLSSLKSSLAQVNIKVDQITVVQDASLKDSGQHNQAQTFSGGNSNDSKGNSGPLKYQASAGARENEDTVQTPNGSYISQGVNYLV